MHAGWDLWERARLQTCARVRAAAVICALHAYANASSELAVLKPIHGTDCRQPLFPLAGAAWSGKEGRVASEQQDAAYRIESPILQRGSHS